MSRTETYWNRNFWLALLGFFSLFMSISLFFIFPLFLKQFNPTESRVGLIMGIHSLMAIFIRPFFGRLIDVRGRKEVSLSGIGLLLLVLPFFHLIRDAGLFPIALRALTGVGWGISMTATITICSDLAPVEKLAHSMGIVGVAGLVSSALGPILAEELVRRYGFSSLFLASSGFIVLAFLSILATKETSRPAIPEKRSGPNPFRLLPFASLILVASLPVFHGAVRSAVVYFIALFGKSIPIERVGPFFLTFSAAAILTRVWIGDISDRYGRKQVIFPAALIISLNCVLISQVRSAWMFLLAGFIGGFGQGLIFPALSTYIIDILGRENKGLALSLYLSLFDVGMGLGSPLFGWVSDLFGYRTMYMIAGSTLLLFSILFTVKAPAPGLFPVDQHKMT
ncbi:MAG: MFS transporter [Clostridiales bacterium]|nr:MFS transporter [Clostridiales bacterium]